MKIQLEEIDIAHPLPELALRDGYNAIRVLVRIGDAPVGEVFSRPTRRRMVPVKRLRRRIARKLAPAIMRTLARDGIAAGPDALRSMPLVTEASQTSLTALSPRKLAQYVLNHVVLPDGLAEPYRTWVGEAARARDWPLPPLTVAIPTADRAPILAVCIEHLRTLDYPDFEILICDNSRDPGPTRQVVEEAAQRPGPCVTYLRVPQRGVSRARNAALRNAATRWVAFTDDDCRPDANWLRELVRPLQDTNCRCVCGLVLPAHLDNSAEITFEIYGGLSRGYVARAYDRLFITRSRLTPAPTWKIGASSNMLMEAEAVLELGGFDEDMGPGAVGGCGEDTEPYYYLLRAGYTVHYTPRPIVRHVHRSTPEALRRQIYGYAVGHAAYHWKIFWRYRDHRSLLQLVWHLPRWFRKNLRNGMRGKTRYPFSLVFLEMKGTVAGVGLYTWAKAKRLGRFLARRARGQQGYRLPGAAGAGPSFAARPEMAAAAAGLTKPNLSPESDESRQKSFRVA